MYVNATMNATDDNNDDEATFDTSDLSSCAREVLEHTPGRIDDLAKELDFMKEEVKAAVYDELETQGYVRVKTQVLEPPKVVKSWDYLDYEAEQEADQEMEGEPVTDGGEGRAEETTEDDSNEESTHVLTYENRIHGADETGYDYTTVSEIKVRGIHHGNGEFEGISCDHPAGGTGDLRIEDDGTVRYTRDNGDEYEVGENASIETLDDDTR